MLASQHQKQSDSLLQSIKHQPYKLEKSMLGSVFKEIWVYSTKICTQQVGPAIAVMPPKIFRCGYMESDEQESLEVQVEKV